MRPDPERALGLGAIGALAFAWSNADGPLRFELQSAAIALKSGQRAAAQGEIERKLDDVLQELRTPAAIGYSVRRGNLPRKD